MMKGLAYCRNCLISFFSFSLFQNGAEFVAVGDQALRMIIMYLPEYHLNLLAYLHTLRINIHNLARNVYALL